MSGRDEDGARREVFLTPLLTWAALMTLLFLSAGAAFAPLGSLKTTASLAIAGVKVVLIALIFMRLSRASSLVRLTALAGLMWASILFLLAGADYISRG